MTRSPSVFALGLIAGLLLPAVAWADIMNFKLLNRYSRATFNTTVTDHAIQIPQLFFLKVANELQLETDLVFVRN